MNVKLKIILSAIFVILFSFFAGNSPAREINKDEEFDIRVERINAIAENTLALYGKGLKDEARSQWQRAYFENFENLEGPIRRQISAGRNIELEGLFGGIRKMIKEGRPYAEIEGSIAGLLDELEKTVIQLKVQSPAVSPAAPQEAGQKTIRQETAPVSSWDKVSGEIKSRIAETVAGYSKENYLGPSLAIQDIYFDVFEASGMEGKIVSQNPGLNTRIEAGFTKITALMRAAKAKKDIEPVFAALDRDLDRAAEILSRGRQSLFSLFLYSLLIIVREGFEAILIICAIIAYLIKTGHKDKVKIIYSGCGIAVAFSFITAVLVKWVFHISAAHQEILEGITMLTAVLVLFFVSFWLISKAEARKWTEYVRTKVDRSLTAGSASSLWLAAFLAVYREGAETVLFYQALGAGLDAAGRGVILGGFIIGCAVLAAVFMGVRFGSMRLPLKPFFIATGALLYYMAFVFAGKGVMELIEGRLISPSLISRAPTVSFLGIYPYWQTLIPQFVLIAAAIAGCYISFRARKRVREGVGAGT